MQILKYLHFLRRFRQLPLVIILSICIVLLIIIKFHIHTTDYHRKSALRFIKDKKDLIDNADDHFHIKQDALKYMDMSSSLESDYYFANITQPECRPRRNIAFLKMHKCGSSTVQNILFRHGQRMNLTFVLPPKKNLISYPALFHKSAILKLPVKYYNILTHHTRFHQEGILEVMPEDTTFISIIREPVTMYESLFTYFRIPYLTGIKGHNSLETFFKNPERYIFLARTENAYSMKNPMLFDFGMTIWNMGDRDKVIKMIKYIDRTFPLVMIAEHFDESLILLKDLLCWNLDDFVYVTLNKRSQVSVQTVTDETAQRMREWNSGDVLLYDYFNRTFWMKVHAFGTKRMAEEVRLLRQKREAIYETCIEKESDNTLRMWRPMGIKVGDFVLKKEAEKNRLCVRMTRPELIYTDILRQQMVKKYHIKLP
ncbi:galactosylceramide sulfotransferase-like [Ptychodera flava]|uniref:galactosylceramide sulfotransferase-like n=1 Tax=Ptychodera flava TaxID=63121 RepID=UPI00396A9CCF